MGSSGSSPANKATSVSSTSSSTALVDPEGESINTLSEYGSISNSRQSSITSFASAEETESASLVLENPNAKFNPNCVFESVSWGQHAVAGIGDEISNLLKNIVGSGGLSIPGGIAAFANAPSAMWSSIIVIWIMGIANAYSFSLLGRICAITKSNSYSMAWERTVGRRYGMKYQLFADGVVFGKAILGTWSFSIIIASTCAPLYRWLENWFGIFGPANGHANNGSEPLSSAFVLVAITLFILLPMCLSQRLASLSIFSAIGTLGTLVTISTMILRYLDGSYLEGGQFYDDLSLNQRPSFGTDKGASAFLTSFKSLTLVSILSTGYVAHYNAPKYYYELKDHTTGRFNIVVTFGFLFAAITYTVVSTVGFLTFGENSMGFVLDNYSYRDPLATIARFGVAISVIFAYPLLFHGGRDGLVSLVHTLSTNAATGSSSPTSTRIRTPTQTESNAVTVLLLFTVTVLAIYVNDLTFVLSFSGATMSSLIIYIFPPFMFSALVKNCCCYVSEDTDREVRLGYAMMIIGAIFGVAGAYVSVERAFF